MADFRDKTRELIAGFTFASNDVPPIDPLVTMRLMNGKDITISERQKPVKATLTNSNFTRCPATSDLSFALTNGGVINIPITRGTGTGKCNGVPYVRLAITNADPSLTSLYVPGPLLFQVLQLLTPSGTPIQNHDGVGLFYCIASAYDYDMWSNVSDAINSSVTYETGVPFPANSTTTLLVPLVGNLLGSSDFFLPAVNGDMSLNCTFWPGSSTKLNGPDCEVTFMSLDIPCELLGDEQLAIQKALKKNAEPTFIYPYERTMRRQQTWNINTQYSIPLTAFKGDVVWMRFGLKRGMTGRDLYSEVQISSFQVQNSAGLAITGNQFIDDVLNRQVQQADWILGSLSEHHFTYLYVWASAKQGLLSMLLNGVKYGAYPFDTFQSLVFNTLGGGTNEVYNLAYNFPATVTQGTFMLQWSTPKGGTCRTIPIAFNTTAADVKAKLEAVLNFHGTVNVTGSANPQWVIEMTGHYGNRPLFSQGYQLTAISAADDAANQAQNLRAVVATAGGNGMTDASTLILEIFGYTSGFCKLQSDGSLLVGYSG